MGIAPVPPSDELVFAPLGGVGEIGMNLAIYGFGDERHRQWIAVDFGVAFADDALPGIDLIMPDIRYLTEERRNLLGLVLTHAHEDHFGALLDLWPRLNIPVYATPFTAALIEAKREGEGGATDIPVNVVPSGGRFRLGTIDIELVSMPHSIPEAKGLLIRTPVGGGIRWTTASSTASVPIPSLALVRLAPSPGRPMHSSISFRTISGSASGRSLLLITGPTSMFLPRAASTLARV